MRSALAKKTTTAKGRGASLRVVEKTVELTPEFERVEQSKPRMTIQGEITPEFWSWARNMFVRVTFPVKAEPSELFPLLNMKDRGCILILPSSYESLRRIHRRDSWRGEPRSFDFIIQEGHWASLSARLSQIGKSIKRVEVF